MTQIRHTLVIAALGLVCLFFILQEFFILNRNSEKERQSSGEEQRVMQQSILQNVQFFSSQENMPEFELKSQELSMSSDNMDFHFLLPSGYTFIRKDLLENDKDNKENSFIQAANKIDTTYVDDYERLDFEAASADYKGENALFTLFDAVKFSMKDLKLTAQKLEYSLKLGNLRAVQNVETELYYPQIGDTLILKADSFFASPKERQFEYVGNVEGQVEKSLKWEKGISFSSSILKVNLDAGTVLAENQVKIARDNVKINALNAEIFLNNYNKKLKYYTLSDAVSLEESLILDSGKKLKRKAYAEKLEAFVEQDLLVLTGNPRVQMGTDTISGNVVTFRMGQELVEVDNARSHFLFKVD